MGFAKARNSLLVYDALMNRAKPTLLCSTLLLTTLLLPGITQADNTNVRTIPMTNAAQPFELAAKLQWNPHDQQWDKVLVLYNGNQSPPATHPVWAYLDDMQTPGRAASKPGENLYYKAFHLNAYCDGNTPLTFGKPLHINFDQNTLGHYTEKDYFRDWNCPGWSMGLNNVSIVGGKEARNNHGQALSIKLPKGASGCSNDKDCANWKPHIGAQLDSLYYSYWVKFPENFDFVLGGKLPGIGSFEPRVGGVKPNGNDGWSVRAMWEKDGKLGQYVYHPDQAKNFGDFVPWDAPPLETGKWYQIKTFVRLNTPGQRDGVITTWLNGKQVLDKHDLRFRNNNNLQIERFLFAVFFGGTGAQWAPKQDTVLYLDDFTLSTQ